MGIVPLAAKLAVHERCCQSGVEVHRSVGAGGFRICVLRIAALHPDGDDRERRHVQLAGELAQLEGSVNVHITHIKPGEMDAVMSQIARLGLPHTIRALRAGQVIDLN